MRWEIEIQEEIAKKKKNEVEIKEIAIINIRGKRESEVVVSVNSTYKTDSTHNNISIQPIYHISIAQSAHIHICFLHNIMLNT